MAKMTQERIQEAIAAWREGKQVVGNRARRAIDHRKAALFDEMMDHIIEVESEKMALETTIANMMVARDDMPNRLKGHLNYADVLAKMQPLDKLPKFRVLSETDAECIRFMGESFGRCLRHALAANELVEGVPPDVFGVGEPAETAPESAPVLELVGT